MLQSTAGETRLTGPQVRARFGNISDMTLWRWLQDPELGFPEPLIIQRRRYWRLADIEAWERAQASRPKAA
jgi:predicted DNA-binding transcriptional regulator AlpA